MILRNIGEIFLFVILVAALYFTFIVFQPFLSVIFIAAVLAIFFYPVYDWVCGIIKNKSISSALVCLLIVALIIIPIFYFLASLTKKSFSTYSYIQLELKNGAIERLGLEKMWSNAIIKIHQILPSVDISKLDLKTTILGLSDNINSFLISATTGLIKGTTQIIIDFGLMILALLYFFKEGSSWLTKLMHLTPLEDKYDREIFTKFREVSIQSVVVTIVIAIAQGLVGAIGFWALGIPAFFLGIVMAFFSLAPLVGPAMVWVPVVLILFATGRANEAIFLLAYGLFVISTIDNVLRAVLMKGKTQVHALFVFFSVLGGIAAFGFWGIFYGPLILAITVTLLHIYEMEFVKARIKTHQRPRLV